MSPELRDAVAAAFKATRLATDIAGMVNNNTSLATIETLLRHTLSIVREQAAHESAGRPTDDRCLTLCGARLEAVLSMFWDARDARTRRERKSHADLPAAAGVQAARDYVRGLLQDATAAGRRGGVFRGVGRG